jgi:uncharacterized protein GlcG (DUF336 family)
MAGTASRPDDADLVRWQGHVTTAGADLAVAAGVAKAAELGVRVGISVVDANGFLQAFTRMDGAPARVEEGASGKARFAASIGRSTGDFIEARLRHDEVLWRAMSGGTDVFIVPGGFPLVHDGRPVGGVGVSGSKHELDSQVAEAAAEAFTTAGGS